MIKFVDDCVGCRDVGLPCLGASCPNQGYVRVCDRCDDSVAKYLHNDMELCKDCLEELLWDEFNEMDIEEKAEALNIIVERISW